MIYFTLIISIFLICMSFIKRNSKLLFWILFIWMWILLSFNYSNADYFMYKNFYEGNLVGQTIESGFAFLCKFFNSIGCPYTLFLSVYGGLALYLIGSTIYKYSNNKNLAAVLYFVFPFVFDAIQLRNFMAFAIIIYSIRFLIEKGRFNFFKYIILNVIAMSFHSYAILGFVFLFLDKLNVKKVYIMLIGLLITLIIILKNNYLLIILSKYMHSQKIVAYFVEQTYAPGLKTVLLSITILLGMYVASYIINKESIKKGKNDENNKFACLTNKICIFMLVMLPLLFYNTVITRFPRSMMILLYIGFSNLIDSNDKITNLRIKKNNLMLIAGLVFINILWYYTFIFSIDNEQSTIISLLNDNFVLDFFKFF